MMMLIRDELIRQGDVSYEISYLSRPGGRPVNEDSVVTAHTEKELLISVADGLGAHGGGDVASGIATGILQDEYAKMKKTNPRTVRELFQKIDDAIVKEQTEDLKMKTTLACVFCRNKRLYGAHIGDTRIYTFHKNKETLMTGDHTFVYEEVMKNHGTLEDVRNHPNRHMLNAALGVGTIRTSDTFRKRLKEQMAVLICSDGFWEYVNEREMQNTLKSTETSHQWLEAMLDYHRAKAGTYHDNYSAICLRVKK